MLSMLQQLYSNEYQESHPMYQVYCQNYFKSVLDPMCEFIESTCSKEMKIQVYNPKIVSGMDFIGNNHDEFLIKPDLVIFGEHHEARIIIEVQPAQMFRDFTFPEFNEVLTLQDTSESNTRFLGMLKRLLVYMVGYKCARGILTDGYLVFLVEIDSSRLRETGGNAINEILLMLNKIDSTSSNPSYLQGILMVPFKFDGNKLLHLEVKLRNKSITNRPKAEHHQKEKPPEDIDDEEDVVVKIFDSDLASMEKLERSEIIRNVNIFYRQEKKAAEILINSHVNTLYLKQVYGLATYNFGFGPLVSGKFIISRYLQANDLPFTDEILGMTKEQLSLIHKAGIVHGDVRELNVLFDKANNKVYFIDFGHATTKVDNETIKGDFQELAEIFEEGRYRLGL